MAEGVRHHRSSRSRRSSRPSATRSATSRCSGPTWPTPSRPTCRIRSLATKLRTGWGTFLGPVAQRGLLSFGPPAGRNVTFVRPSAWLGRPISPEELAAATTRRPRRRPAGADRGARRPDQEFPGGLPGLRPRRDRPLVGRVGRASSTRRGRCSATRSWTSTSPGRAMDPPGRRRAADGDPAVRGRPAPARLRPMDQRAAPPDDAVLTRPTTTGSTGSPAGSRRSSSSTDGSRAPGSWRPASGAGSSSTRSNAGDRASRPSSRLEVDRLAAFLDRPLPIESPRRSEVRRDQASRAGPAGGVGNRVSSDV